MSRCWCFTVPYGSDHPFDTLDLDQVKFIVVGEEHGEPTAEKPEGYHHFQGYIVFHTNKRMTGVKGFLKRSFAHCEIAKGSPDQNIRYCTKEHEHFRHGEVPESHQGQRMDLIKFKTAIKDGSTELELYERFPMEMIKFPRFFQQYRRALDGLERETKSFYPMEVIYIYGMAGTGKSRMVMEKWPGAYRVPIAEGQKLWMDGYKGEETIVLEDFESSLPYRTLLRITDVYPMQVEVKGGFVSRNWRRVVFTSNLQLNEQYPDQHERMPLERRVTEVIHLTSEQPPAHLPWAGMGGGIKEPTFFVPPTQVDPPTPPFDVAFRDQPW